ncbi:MAG: archaeosortase/exosortase family protein [Planctomycetota bacterium]|nr:archaeosortase/exosortase family protein [Planctomycetota bacterium]
MFWCDQRLQLTIDGPGTSRSLVIPRPYARIGADEAADVVLPLEATGGRRWYLHATGNGVYCVELGKSVKSTRRRGRWVTPTQELELGTHSLYVKSVSGNGGPEVAGNSSEELVGDEPDAVEKPVVEFVSGTQSPRRRQLGRLTIVGNDRPSHLRIEDADLEAAHCVLYWSAGSLWVVDLLSAGGTWRDGTRYEVTSISRGDSIQIGQTTLTLLGAKARSDRGAADSALGHSDEETDSRGELRSQELTTREVQVKREERLLEKLRSREERLQARQQQRAAAWNAQRAEQGRVLETRAQQLDAREAELQQREAELVRRQQEQKELAAETDRQPARVAVHSAAPADEQPVLPVNELQAWRLRRMDPPAAELPENPGDAGGRSFAIPAASREAAVPAPGSQSRGLRLVQTALPVVASVALTLGIWPLVAEHVEALWYRAEYQLFPLVIALAMFLLWLRRPVTGNTAVAQRSRFESPLALGTVLLLIAGVTLPSPEIAVAGALGMAGVLLVRGAGRAALTHWALPWMLLWLVIPLPQGWDLRWQIAFETLVGRLADFCLRITAGTITVPTDHALLDAACTSWTAPMVSIAVGVFLVVRRPRHWLALILLLAAVIPFALLVSMLVVVLERWEYAVAGDSGPLSLLGSAAFLFSVDTLLGVLFFRRANQGSSDSAPASTAAEALVASDRRAARHWWLTAPVLLVLALFQSALWWRPEFVLSRDPNRQVSLFPHAAWKQGALPKLRWQGQVIEPGSVEVVTRRVSGLQSYHWTFQGTEFEVRLAIELPLANWQAPTPVAVGWFDAPPLQWLPMDPAKSSALAMACRSPTGGDHHYLLLAVFDGRGGAVQLPAARLDSWQSELVQLVDRSLLARVVGWPAATCRLRLEFASQTELTKDELRRVTMEFQRYVTWLEQTFQQQHGSE